MKLKLRHWTLGSRKVSRLAWAARNMMRFGHFDTRGTLNTDHSLKGRFCSNPFRQLDIHEEGRVYSCCSAWLPTPIGNIRHSSIREVWNSPASRAIRESILDGSFRYCNHKICPHIQEGNLPTFDKALQNSAWRSIIEQRKLKLDELPTFINLCNDVSCNLRCPSCRTRRILFTEGKEYEKRRHLQDIITEQLFAEPSDQHFRLNITGSGDPFASRVFRDFLYSLNGGDFPNLSIHLQTNGVLLTPKTWGKLHKIHANIKTILISFDAATEATYYVTRPGGDWKTLLANTRRLGELRRNNKLRHLRLDFVVQQANFREMPEFVQLGKALNAGKVNFSMVLDWGTWSWKEYQQQCIWKSDHPEFDDFMEVLRNPVFADPIVSLGNINEYRKVAVGGASVSTVSP